MLVKSKRAGDHIQHLVEAIEILRRYQMKLNPSKCSFRRCLSQIPWIRCNSKENRAKSKANQSIQLSTCNLQDASNKDVQKLVGRVAVQKRFIYKSLIMCKLFYDELRKNKSLEWTSNHEEAFQNLLTYMMTPPLLSKAKVKEAVQLYLAITHATVSVVSIREEDGTQSPIYYVGKTLVDAETRYNSLEKLILAFSDGICQVASIFERYPICFKTNYCNY